MITSTARVFLTSGQFSLKVIPNSNNLEDSECDKLFSNFDACCTQNSDSTIFYKKLGIINTEFTGNLKFAHHDIKIDEERYMVSVYIANVSLWMEAMNLWDSFSERISTSILFL